MWKKKAAVLVALVFAMGLTLAACSTTSGSSTEDALSHQGGDNYLGSIQVTVSPTAGTITVTPVANAVSDTTYDYSAEPLAVSTTGVTWDGAGTITGEMAVAWTGAEILEDVSIRIWAIQPSADAAVINNDDVCGSQPLLNALAASCYAGIVYVGDEVTDSPETEIELDYTQYVTTLDDIPGSGRVSRSKRMICPQCGSVTATWSMTEGTAGFPNYTFYAYVYGTKAPAKMCGADGICADGAGDDDPRYRADHASVKLGTYNMNAASKFPAINQASPTNTVAPGEWVFASLWFDMPGNNRPGTGLCADSPYDSGGDLDCDILPGVNFDNKDWYFLEDQDNKTAYDTAGYHYAGTTYNPLSTTFGYNYNTGYLFMGGGSWEISWDPAVLSTNDSLMGSAGWWGSGVDVFKCQGALGTNMHSVWDDQADQFLVAGNSSNFMNKAFALVDASYAWPADFPPMPDLTDNYAGFVQGDFHAGRAPLRGIGNVGDGTRVQVNATNMTTVYVCVGNGSSTQATAICVNQGPSDKWPLWEVDVGIFKAALGAYNLEHSWLCIE